MQIAAQIIVGITTGALILYAIVATARSIRREITGRGCACGTERNSCPFPRSCDGAERGRVEME